MRSPASTVFRPRRALALAGLVSLTGGLLMFPALAHPARAVAGVGAPAASTTSGTTVTGKNLWDPAKNKPLPNPSSVTVDQTHQPG